MSLPSGTRIGSYEIVAKLGEGGMGEVYRARDTRLDRLVALKVLPRDVRDDPERRERFEREAKAIAALNHPNIVTIHSVENVEALSFLTMELVEGAPLSSAITTYGLPLDRILAMATPLVDAVAAAHQKGITHRDLKPANVMVDTGGRVKVLDFGLAKIAGGALAGDGVTALPTALATGEGRVLGTVAYMSPEQAEGKAVDARSDLFSIGVILYEMATGRRPFDGETTISIISAIIKDTPTSITELNPAMPRDLARIVRRALAKDPERRYQTAKDLRNDLEELKASLDSGELAAAGRAGPPLPHDRRARLWPWLAGGAVVVTIAAVAIAMTLQNRAGGGSNPAPSVQLVALTSSGTVGAAAISPDGKHVAYVQRGDAPAAPLSPSEQTGDSLWLQNIASRSAVTIVQPEPGVAFHALTITPDGNFVDYIRVSPGSRWEMWRVPLLGGPARRVAEHATSPPGWSPDGTRMAYLNNVPPNSVERQLVVADADGSNARPIATRKLPQRYVTLTMTYRPDTRPIWLPDGQSIVVQASDESAHPGEVQIVRVDVVNGAETLLYRFPSGVATGRWAAVLLEPDGRSMLATVSEPAGAPAQVVRINLADGSSTRLTNDLAPYGGLTRAGDVVVTIRGETRSSIWVADASGRGERQIGRDLQSRVTHLAWASPSRLIYVATRLAGGFGLWASDLAGDAQLIVSGAVAASLTADRRVLVFEANGRQIWRAEPDGSRATRLANLTGSSPYVSPDGSRVFFTSSQSGIQSLWVAELSGSAPRQFSPLLVNGYFVSPDGRYVALRSLGEQRGIHLLSSDGQSVRMLPRLGAGGDIQWTPDSDGLAYVSGGSNIWVQPISGAASRQLLSFSQGNLASIAWSPDRKQIALVRHVYTSDLVMLKGVK